MKKLLAVSALFLTFSLTSTDAVAKEKEQDCLAAAWDFGTLMSTMYGGDPYWYTDAYYMANCN
ncbi:MAG: hypothetical protein ACTH6S_03390 [Mesonia sp.]|uniref:hypothetical protein n=1 Tax=Mesonia sp. TaxID=1960830 RepID=UPI003F9BC570